MFITVKQVGKNGNVAETEVASIAIIVLESIMRQYGGVEAPDRRSVGAKSRITLSNGREIEVLETVSQVRSLLSGKPIEREKVLPMTKIEPPLSLLHLSNCVCETCKLQAAMPAGFDRL